jgi:hypothetical protein
MSIKRQLEFRYRNLMNKIRHLSLPEWLVSKTTRIVLIILIIGIGGAYVSKITSSATRGFQMHKLENDVSGLEQDISKIEIEIAENSSLSNIQKRLAKLDMVEAGQITYISGKDISVAKK